jgi:hypothetical protein
VNAFIPSVLQVVLTQSHVDLYFCPVAGENPSVCIRDLIISIGYITAQSYDFQTSEKYWVRAMGTEAGMEMRSNRISGRGAEQDRFCGVHLIPFDPLLRHLPLHQLLVRPEINSISASFTVKGRNLSLVNPGDPIGREDLLDGVPRTGIESSLIRLGLKTCGRETRKSELRCWAEGNVSPIISK